MNYQTLTPLQKVQAAYLFADEHFGGRACDYDYYLDEHGDIKGRTALIPANARARVRKAGGAHVTINAETQVTDAQCGRADAAGKSMARVIARNIYSEVEHARV